MLWLAPMIHLHIGIEKPYETLFHKLLKTKSDSESLFEIRQKRKHLLRRHDML